MKITLAEHSAEFKKELIGTFISQEILRMGLEGLFPRETYQAQLLSIQVQRNRQLVAVDVQRCTDPHRNIFSKSTEKLFRPPFYKESIDFCKCDGYEASYGSGIVPSEGVTRTLASSTIREMQAIKNKVERAIELQRSQVLQTGIVTLKNGDSIDYKRRAESISGVTTPWSDPTADAYGDLVKGMRFLRGKGQSSATSINVIFGENALTNFMQNDAVKENLEIRRADKINIVMPQFDNVTGMVYHGQASAGDFIINIWTYNESYLDPDDNVTEKNYIDPDNVIMVPSDFIGETSFASTPLVRYDSDGTPYVTNVKGQYTVYDIIYQVKAAWEIIVQSSPLVVPISIDRIYTIATGN